MKIRSLAIVLLAFFLQIIVCKAQSHALPDTSLVIDLNKKAWEAHASDPEKSLKYAQEAIHAANRIGYTRGLSYSYNMYGNYHKVKGNYDSALFYFNKSLLIRQKLGDLVGIARSYRNLMSIEELRGNNKKAINTAMHAIGILRASNTSEALAEKAMLKAHVAPLCFQVGDYKQALNFASEAGKIFEKLQDEDGLAMSHMNLGYIYDEQQLYTRALREYHSAVAIYTRLENWQELARACNNMGTAYYNTGNYEKAKVYYVKGLALRKQYGFTDEIKRSLLNVGLIHEAFGKGDSAEHYYQQALNLSVKSGELKMEFATRWDLGTFLYKRGNHSAALRQLLKAQELLPSQAISVENNNLFNNISEVYEAMGRGDSALFYSRQYTRLNDSLNEILRKSIELGAAYKEKEQEMKIIAKDAAFNQEIAKYNEEKAKTQAIVLSAAILFLIIIFFLYYLFVRSKRNMQELREVVKDKELKVLDAMLEGQHEERKRLATELHDTIGSTLAATKYLFKGMEKTIEKMLEENKGQYRKINIMLDETMESVRRISHNMASGIFTEKGMEGALADLSQTFEQAGRIRIHLSVYGFDQRPEYNIEVNLYRMVQELLTNIMKHAQAREVTIQLIKSSENINLTVEDDGRGFDPLEAKRKKGIGLSNIELRVKKLSGKWNIDSGKGRGTTVIIDIPVKNNEEQRK